MMCTSSCVLGVRVLALCLLCHQVAAIGMQELCPEHANVNDACNNDEGTCQEATENGRLRCVLASRPVRIINGENTTTDEHVHQVSLHVYYQEKWQHSCGGSVIDGRWIVTAAHCVYGWPMEYLRVIVDKDDTYQVYSLDRVEWFPEYVDGDSKIGFVPNDIALMKTSAPIRKAGFYKVELAPPGETFVGVSCTITGWGLVQYNSEGVRTTEVLQVTHGIVLPNEECVAKHYLGGFNGTHNICIHNEDTGACLFDSGGPMVCNGVLAGVNSWGISCLTRFPSVYTRVTNFLDWINSIIESE